MASGTDAKLRALQGDAERLYVEWKKASEAQVVRWVWTNTDAWFLEPFFAERMNAQSRRDGRAPLFKKARVLGQAPEAPKYGTMRYGYDDAGRVVVACQYFTATGFGERFYAWRDKTVEWVSFNGRQWPEQYGEAELDGAGRVVETRSGERTARFAWRDGVLVRAEVQYGAVSQPQVESEEEIASALHAKPAPPRNPARLLARLEPLVADAVVAAFDALALREPAYCLIVSYAGPGNDLYPPLIGVGLERERQALLARQKDGALGCALHEVLWDVGDFARYPATVITDEALVRETNRALHERAAWKAARASFERVAEALRKRKWSPVTEDFIVAAIDFEGTNQWLTLKKAAGAKRYGAWRKAGWVE